MGFKTFTCCICKAEGLTKRTSKAFGTGRCCNHHTELADKKDVEKKAKLLVLLGYLSIDDWKRFPEINPSLDTTAFPRQAFLDHVKWEVECFYLDTLKNTTISSVTRELFGSDIRNDATRVAYVLKKYLVNNPTKTIREVQKSVAGVLEIAIYRSIEIGTECLQEYNINIDLSWLTEDMDEEFMSQINNWNK